MVTFSDWIRERSDAQLVTLLSHRGDLASPSPSTLLSLAARATSRASLQRATAALDSPHLEVLESVAVLDLLGEPVTPERVVEATSPSVHAPSSGTEGKADATLPDHPGAVRDALAALEEAALVWQPAPGSLRPAPGIEETLDAYPAGLGPARRSRDVRPDPALLDGDDVPPGARSILAALTWGPPVGRIPADADSPSSAPTRWLLDHGFVKQVDAHHVVLPRETAMALRAGRTHRGLRRAPALPAPTLSQATVDAESARAAQEIVRLVAEVLTTWQVAPATALKSGGLGVRDLRRLAQHLETDEPTTAVVVELALMAALVVDDGGEPVSYAPTLEADEWLAADLPTRWSALVTAWSTSARTPWLVGTRDERGTLRGALEPELHRLWVPRLRSQVLRVLAEAPRAPVDADAVVELLGWHAPRSVPPRAAVAALLREAGLLGLTGAGALSPTGALLAAVPPQTVPDDATVLALAAALAEVLPEAVDEILLQGDLTGIVPGRPSSALETLLAESAEVESRGSGITVRFTPASVTRALDAGRTGEELLLELAVHSRGPVPQPLDYLVRDATRRHGQLRLGVASSYVRVDDPVLLAGLVEDPRLRSLGLFRIAPTVIAASASAGQLLTALRERGLAPAMEGPDGTILHADRRTPQVRLAGRRARRLTHRPRSVDGAVEHRGTPQDRTARLVSLVARLREQSALTQARRGPQPGEVARPGAGTPGAAPTSGSRDAPPGARRGDAPGAGGPAPAGTSDPVVALGLLREAVADSREVWLEMAGPTGGTVRRRVRPLRVDAGRLRAVDVARESELTVAVHRIARVEHVEPLGES